MAEVELEGYTLGQRHQHYNKLVKDAIKNNMTVTVEDFNLENSDVTNLLNIDIASYNKNVEYILQVLTCGDMLYVSRVFKQSSWLINDQNYAHIINPKYLRSNLFPKMCTKAIIKLIKHIRNILKDEKRAEEFYVSEENPKEAVQWLPCCSLEFIEKKITNHIHHIKTVLLRRICEKSITVLEIYIKNEATHKKHKALQVTMFLLSFNIDRFLNLVEDLTVFPKFNKKATILLMKKSAHRVIDKFDKYYNFIHLPTFITCLKHENIKDFLLNQAQNIDERQFYRNFNLNNLLLFIRLIPQEIRFEFVKEVFINRAHESKENCALSDKEKKAMTNLCNITSSHLFNQNHIWYQFAPFDIAFQKLQELIGFMSFNREKIFLLEVVLTSAQNKVLHERTFLEYLRDNRNNIDNKVREKIVTKLIIKSKFVNYDIDTWNVLEDIFKGIDIYAKLNSEPVILEAIILYNVIHKVKVSEIVENKFNFNSLVTYHKKLSDEEKEMVFIYLYDLILAKITKCKTTNEEEFKEKVDTLNLVLVLLKDYSKDLESYPSLIYIIQDLAKVKNDLSWTVNIESLFNIKKTWRKLLFEQSLMFCQTESVLLNALKHGPSLMDQNKNIFKNMLCNDKMPLKQFLGKIKIYWSTSLGKNLTLMYTEKLNCLKDHKATTRGLSILLPLGDLQELIKKHTPKDAKINWGTIDEVELSIQQQLAKNMHMARPHPFPETILQFAKGDYLQYALSSLLAMFYNLNSLSSQKYILNLLDAPVSLQKHGIRIAVAKFRLDQLLCNFSNIWKNNKNASIRSVLFKTVYELICKENDSNKIEKIWELMELFIDTITLKEDKAIYKLLFQIENIPLEVRGQFYMKSYKFLHHFINSSNEYEDYEYKFYTTYTAYSREIIDQLEPNFVVEIILEYIDTEFTKKQTDLWSRGCVISVISSYLLSSDNEQTQLERYKDVFLPLLRQSFALWNTEDFIKNNLVKLLDTLRIDTKHYVIDMKRINPHKMFSLIQEELKHALETSAHYILLTKWKLTVTFIATLNAYSPITQWEETCIKIANEFGNKCNDYLREDCNKYFHRIYMLFVKALDSMLSDFIPEIAYWNIYRSFIQDKTFIQGYLAAIMLISSARFLESDQEVKEKKRNFKELCENICKHPSTEIKIHYYAQIKQIK